MSHTQFLPSFFSRFFFQKNAQIFEASSGICIFLLISKKIIAEIEKRRLLHADELPADERRRRRQGRRRRQIAVGVVDVVPHAARQLRDEPRRRPRRGHAHHRRKDTPPFLKDGAWLRNGNPNQKDEF